MEVKAKARFVRMSPRKVRLVVDAIRGLSALEAREQLRLMNKAAATPVLKLLNSAIANAENNFKLSGSGLKIKEIAADDGPTFKRWRPRAMGRAGAIRKRTSHISIVLEDATVPAPVKSARKTSKKAETQTNE